MESRPHYHHFMTPNSKKCNSTKNRLAVDKRLWYPLTKRLASRRPLLVNPNEHRSSDLLGMLRSYVALRIGAGDGVGSATRSSTSVHRSEYRLEPFLVQRNFFFGSPPRTLNLNGHHNLVFKELPHSDYYPPTGEYVPQAHLYYSIRGQKFFDVVRSFLENRLLLTAQVFQKIDRKVVSGSP